MSEENIEEMSPIILSTLVVSATAPAPNPTDFNQLRREEFTVLCCSFLFIFRSAFRLYSL